MGFKVPNGISLNNPRGSNWGVEGLPKGIGGVGFGVGVSDGEGASDWGVL